MWKYLLGLLLPFSACSIDCSKTRVVAYVGGCNRSGTCGVMFVGGTSGWAHLPAPGMKMHKVGYEWHTVREACGK